MSLFKRLVWLAAVVSLPPSLLLTFRVTAQPYTEPGAIIISELAWAGTAASASDEWIELYNTTPLPINLSGWSLRDGNDINIALDGTIPAQGFLLLERTDDNSVADVSADLIYAGGIANSGEVLTLRDSTNTVIDRADGASGWPAGAADFSMERKAASSHVGWISNDGLTRHGRDANGNPLNATPRAPNAAWRAIAALTQVRLDAVLYKGQANGQGDEAVALRNLGNETAAVGGWQLSDGVSTAVLPSAAIIPPYGVIWLAKNRADFNAQFGAPPDYAMDAGLTGTWPGFADTGDEVILRNDESTLVDVLVYAAGNVSQAGWFGAAVVPFEFNSGVAERGQILYRKRDQLTALPVADTDTAADWAQDPQDIINGRKVRYPGWQLDQFFFTAKITETAVLTVAIAPDNAYAALVAAIGRARESIKIETHTFENIALVQPLIAARQRGVAVTILLEGGPPGGIADEQRYICQRLEAAGGACWFMVNREKQAIYDRYGYMHAKFMLIDGRIAVIGSENLSPNSLPADDKRDGTVGRRGVYLMTTAVGVVARLEAIFAADFNPARFRDIVRYSESDPELGPPPPDFVPLVPTVGTTYTVRFPEAAVFQGSFAFEVVQAPENSLRDVDGLLGLVGRAGKGDTVLVQQLAERPYWGPLTSNPEADPNPRLEAYIAAARRGARVRLLLDSVYDDATSLASNQATCAAVRAIATAEALDLDCARANPTGLGIHNKMVLIEVDGRGYAHVGSLNGTEQSNKANREVALQVQSDAVHALLATLFAGDWPKIIYLPLLAHDNVPPAQYPLISEILYDPSGPDSAEFVELVNPTARPVDLTNFSLSDALLPSDFADLRRFPAGTVMAPDETLVIAQQAVAFKAVFGVSPDFEILETDTAVPNLIDDRAWGDTATFLQLGNAGDVVLLRNAADVPVDVVAYGAGVYANQPGCALIATGHSLRRDPYWRDTDDCTADFRPWPAPNPGIIP